MLTKLKILWQMIRRLSGDDAYEQYLKHYAKTPPGDGGGAPPTPTTIFSEEFFKQWEGKKGKGR